MNDVCRTRPFKCFAITALLFGSLLAASFTGFLHLDRKFDKVYDKIIAIYKILKPEKPYELNYSEFNKAIHSVKASDNF